MNEFEQVIRQLISLFEEFQPLEEEKLQAAQENSIKAIEDCMTREQAMTLKLRGLEGKRAAVQKQNGWEGMTFRQILDAAPEEESAKLRPLCEELERKMVVFQSTNEGALEIISLHLRQIQKAMEAKGSGGYDQDGKPIDDQGHMTNQKV